MFQIQFKRVAQGLSVSVFIVAVYGCSQNTSTPTASAPSTPTTSSIPTAQKTEKGGDNHDAEIRAAVGPFFPGAQLVAKPFPFNDTAAAHLSEEAGVKFSGKEGNWQVFDATRNGQRVGLAVMTHSALPDGKDMHIAFAVNSKFAVTGITPLDAPDNAKMRAFAAQMKGKTYKSAFKVGQDLKATAGMPQPVAQIGADAIHKGLVILEENFNPQHGADEAAGASHTEGDGHAH